jgi:di/tricarboxylate transporter
MSSRSGKKQSNESSVPFMTDEYVGLALMLAGAVYLFWTGKLRTDLVALLVMLALIVPWPHLDGRWRPILTYPEGFSGFGSPAVIMVVAMFIFGAAMVRTGMVEYFGGRLFKACAHRELLLQSVVLAVTTLFSMFVNDTTVVLVFLPVIMSVCKEKNLSPSRYLMAVAYGSLLGGQWTLIGTRSNVVISDYLLQRTGAGFGFFDPTPIAAVIFAACAGYFLLVGRRFLPRSSEVSPIEDALNHKYLTEVSVTARSPAIGKTLDEWIWGKRADVSVLEVIRGPERVPAYRQLSLQPGDVLIMEGPASTIGELLESSHFELKQELLIGEKTLRSQELVTIEALLAPDSNYAGLTLEEVQFGPEFNFTVMGISRRGKTTGQRVMATPLKFGDSLLLLGHVSGLARLRRNQNLILLDAQTFTPLGGSKALIVVALLVGMIASVLTGLLSPAISIPLVAMLAILFGCVRVSELYRLVDWPSVITVAGMIPFGLALEKTGAAEAIARVIGHNVSPHQPMMALGVILLLAIVLTQLIENAAVAIIFAPIAYRVSLEAGVDPKPFLVALALCVSAAFCSPVAHESTILVAGPGRYQFKHYLRIGGAMAVLTWLLATWLAPLIWPFR